MVINGQSLLIQHPIIGMFEYKVKEHGVSYGLTEAGYDIRIKQEIKFDPNLGGKGPVVNRIDENGNVELIGEGRFIIASSIEEFDMPLNLVGVLHDKSTWAREGLSVFNTVIEPGWKGFLTLELVFHGNKPITIPAGAGIGQVLFHRTFECGKYEGKYQNQEDKPVESRFL